MDLLMVDTTPAEMQRSRIHFLFIRIGGAIIQGRSTMSRFCLCFNNIKIILSKENRVYQSKSQGIQSSKAQPKTQQATARR
jgi:hypothetical protein